ncbi:SDR family oxidoreductase [Granulosicoccaceae sp. 1_MG-2023]|nr:SDR family oxidoreductase [Granulosicoccaceae sp. 1_MG-2023]
MDLGVAAKVYMIAGASRGLGFGIAKALAEEGAIVSIASRDETAIKAAAASLAEQTGAEVHGFAFDATDAQSVKDWTAAVQSKYGRIDGLAVNAGGPPVGLFDDFADEDWQKAFELTLLSAVRMIRAVLPVMRAGGGGSIITLTSSSVKEPIDNLLLSNVMRSGVVSLAKSLSRQLAPENIRVNNLVPGLIYTDRLKSLISNASATTGKSEEEVRASQEKLIPMGRYGDPDEFGKAGAFLLSPAASYVSGETLIVDGGSMKTVW